MTLVVDVDAAVVVVDVDATFQLTKMEGKGKNSKVDGYLWRPVSHDFVRHWMVEVKSNWSGPIDLK